MDESSPCVTASLITVITAVFHNSGFFLFVVSAWSVADNHKHVSLAAHGVSVYRADWGAELIAQGSTWDMRFGECEVFSVRLIYGLTFSVILLSCENCSGPLYVLVKVEYSLKISRVLTVGQTQHTSYLM